MKYYSLQFYLVTEIDMAPEPPRQVVSSTFVKLTHSVLCVVFTHNICSAQNSKGQQRIIGFFYA